MGIVIAIVVIIVILILIGKYLPEQKGCSDCKHWGGPSQQGRCNLTGDLYMKNGCSLEPR